VYKSHTVRVPSGEPAGSLSRPPAKRKAGVVRPITQGKLLKAGGPSVRSSRLFPVVDVSLQFRSQTTRVRALLRSLCLANLPAQLLLASPLLSKRRHQRLPRGQRQELGQRLLQGQKPLPLLHLPWSVKFLHLLRPHQQKNRKCRCIAPSSTLLAKKGR
jgi:hypothetical protein